VANTSFFVKGDKQKKTTEATASLRSLPNKKKKTKTNAHHPPLVTRNLLRSLPHIETIQSFQQNAKVKWSIQKSILQSTAR
jgi:hypothetical protein